MAIIHPLQPRMSKTMTLNITICVWAVGSLLSLPNFVFSKLSPEPNETRTTCVIEWPDGDINRSEKEYIYNIIIALVTYVVPIISMSFTYYRVGKELWGSKGIGECTSRQIDQIKSKKKIVKMMIVVFVIFAICWLPYHVAFLITHHFPHIRNSKIFQHTYLFIYWLAMSNSMYNPMIYCWLNSRFRQGFKKVFCFICMKELDSKRIHEARYNKKMRYSTSEVCTTDTRVRYSQNGDLSMCIALTEALIDKDGSPETNLKSKRSVKFRMEML